MNNEKHLVISGMHGISLPSYMRIITNHYKDPYETTRIQWKARGCFRGSSAFVFALKNPMTWRRWQVFPLSVHRAESSGTRSLRYSPATRH